jgi:putative ABC transport system permease protein
MKLRIYFKQAWNLIKQEKLFSSIYILGTGLSIMIVMVLAIVFYLKIANIYPETNRDRMLIVKSGTVKPKNDDKAFSSSYLSLKLIETCLMPLKNAKAIAVINNPFYENNELQIAGSNESLPVTIKRVNTAFWTVFPFRFTDGKPFTEADFQSGIATAVISESLSRKLFGTTEATGKTINLDFKSFRVCGVVKDVSLVTARTYAQIWIPYTVFEEYKNTFGPEDLLGNMQAYILPPSKKDMGKLKEEITENIHRLNQTLKDHELSINGQPDEHWQSTFRLWSNDTPKFNKIVMLYCLVFLIFLLIPSISLSGMTESRTERRLAEMGVRRAFGAPIRNLMGQIISENFLFTLLGSALGLLISYLFVLFGRNWILQIGQTFVDIPLEGTNVAITPSMLLNIPVFAIALGVCFILNLLCALIPAWRAAHKEIIYSLNAKQ